MKRVRLLADSYSRGDENYRKGQVIEVPDEDAERLVAIEAATDQTSDVGMPKPSDELADLTVAELDEKLDAADLPKTGNKAAKIERLRAAEE